MLQAMFSGVSGLQANQTKMDVIGNNIANVNTVGFKAGRVSFEDQLSQTMRAATVPIDGSSTLQIPLGVLTSVQQTSNATFAGNLDASSALISTKVDYAGNLDSTATPGTSIPSAITSTVYDGQGNAHTVKMTFSN